MTCVLLGLGEDSSPLDSSHPNVIDMRSQTASVRDLAACLMWMDVIVAHDSFILHLAGALQRPTIGLFAPTSARHAEPYPGIRVLASEAICAPCHTVQSQCPKGFSSCVAWEGQSLSGGG